MHSEEGIERNIKNHAKLFHSDLGVDFKEGGKPENPEKNTRSTRETNYNNSTHMSSSSSSQSTRGYTQVVTHPAIYNSVRPGLITSNSAVKSNALSASTIHALQAVTT